MIADKAGFTVNVDVTNPGQFFACCGLLELSNRLWPGAEGIFADERRQFVVQCNNDSSTGLDALMQQLTDCQISGLTGGEQQERVELEAERKRLKKEGKRLSPEKEERRKGLGTMARKGVISLGNPFRLDLNWWQTNDLDIPTPKTWAGLQEIHKVARSAQDSLRTITDLPDLLNHSSVLRMPEEYRKSVQDQSKVVEPFYFDARRFVHALDVGFSLDVQDAETIAHPAVELLALIGLQRFRPGTSDVKWGFHFSTWSIPLNPAVAASVACGAVLMQPQQRYVFQLLFRDDQRRYKAFSYATQ